MSAPPASEPDVLDRAAIAAALEGLVGRPAAPVEVLAETASTNDFAKDLAKRGAPNGTLVVAESQTAGRGRSGNVWHSPAGESLYASIVLRPGFAPSRGASFTLAVGVVVAELVEARLPGRAVGIKWPNDVWVGARKIAGILVEAQVRGDAATTLVVGVGINVRTRAFPGALEGVATSLALEGARELDRSALAADLAARVVAAAESFRASGLAPFMAGLAARDVLVGRRVRVGDEVGRARGISTTGELELACADGTTRRVGAGHVELVSGADD